MIGASPAHRCSVNEPRPAPRCSPASPDRRRPTRGLLLLLPVLLIAAAGIAHAQSPTVSIADAEPVVEGGTLEFLVTLSQASDNTITVPWNGGEYRDRADTDYCDGEGTLTFPPGVTKQTIRYPTCDDDVDELQNWVQVVETQNFTAGAEGLILDNDGLFEVTVAAQSSTVTEGQDAVFTLTRAEGENLSAPLTVSFTVTGGDAVLTGAPPTSATFGAGMDTVRVTLATANDTTDEPNATLTLTLAESNAYFLDRRLRVDYPGPIKPREATVTVRDDDDPPTVSIADPPAVVEGETIEFLVSLSHASDEEIAVSWQATEVRKGNADYNGQSGTVIFPPGVTEQTIPFTTEDDLRDEQRGTNKVQMYVAWSSYPPARLEVRTLDNDGLFDVTVAAETAAVTEGRYVSFLLTRTEGEDLSTPLTVSFTVSGGDAVLTNAAPTSVTFQRGVDKVRVTLATANDRTDEPDATLTLTLAESDAYFLGEGPPVTFGEFPPQPREATATVRDDDDPPTVSIADAPAVKEGGTLAFPVRLTHPSATEIRVDYTLGGTATAGTDYTDRGSGTVTFAPGVIEQTISLATIEDDAFETDDETVEVTLSAPATGTASLGAATGTGTIRNDDHEISFGAGTNGQENHATDGNVPVRFKVVLDPPATVPITVDYETFDDTATAGADYEATSGTLTFEVNETEKTVEVPVIDDAIVEREEHESVGLRLSNVSASPGVPVAIPDAEETRTMASEDLYVLSFDSPSVAEGHSGTTDLTFTASLSKAADFDVRMNLLTHAGGTATAGEDYARPIDAGATFAPSRTFAPGETEKTVTVSVTGDDEVESDETVRFKGVPGSHCAVPENPIIDCFVEPGRHEAIATGTIRNDDHEISIDRGENSHGYEYDGHLDGPRSIKFKVVLDPPAPAQVTVRYETVASTALDAATSGVDYTPTDGTLTFAPGDTEKTVEVVVLDDDIVEQSENVVLRLSNASTASEAIGVAIADAELSRSITSDDEYALSVDSPSVLEGRSGTTALTFTVRLSKPAGFQVKAGFSTGGGTATAGVDYVAITDQELTFPAGVTEQQVAVTVNGDAVREPDETVDVTVTLRPGYAGKYAEAGGDTATGRGTILDTGHEISFGAGSNGQENHASDGNQPVRFKVVLDPPAAVPITVRYQPVGGDGLATSGVDYTPASGTLTFAPNETEQTVEVAVIDDDLVEPAEAVQLSLSDATASSGGRVTIADYQQQSPRRDSYEIVSEDRAELTVDSPSVAEGQSGSTALTFTATLSKAASFPVKVDYTVGGTATAGEDYDAAFTDGSLTFQPGETRKQLTATVDGDEDFEPDEMVQLTFTVAEDHGANAFVSVGDPATGTIRNDDRTISIHGADSWGGFENDPDVDEQYHSIRFKVVLDQPASAPVTVDYETFDDTASGSAATAGADYVAKSGTLTFAPNETEQTVDITLIDDDVVEYDESVGLRLSNASSDSEEIGVAIPETEASRSIYSDDQYALSIDSPSVVEGRSGTTELTFTVSLSKEAGFPVPISYTVGGGTATAGEDYVTPADSSLTFAAGETRKQITVTVNGDTVHEPNETVEVTVSLHPGVAGKYAEAGGDTATGTGTILGDDHRISFGDGSDGYENHADDGNQPVSFKVVLDPPATVPVTVNYVTADGTATSPEDFVSWAGLLRFNPGQTEKLLEFAVKNDGIVEEAETLELVLSSPMVEGSDVAGSVAAASTVTVPTARRTRNIHSDDRYALSIDSPSVDEGDAGSTDLTFTIAMSKAAAFPVTIDYATVQPRPIRRPGARTSRGPRTVRLRSLPATPTNGSRSR